MLLRPLFLLLACACTITAQPAEIVTYDSLPARIRAANPHLAAARMRVHQALGRFKQSGRLANPHFETTLEHNHRFNEGQLEIGLSQRFPLTNRLALEKQVTLAAVDAAEAEIRNVERRLVADARAAYVRVLSIRQRRAHLLEQVQLSETLATSIAEAAEAGELPALDAGQAKLTTARLSTRARVLSAEEAAAAGELKPLLGLATTASLNLSGNLPEPVIPAAGDTFRRPDLDLARIETEAADRNIQLQHALAREDAEAGIFAAAERSEDAPNGRETEAIVGIRFSIPIPFWNRNEGAIDEATATRERKELEAIALNRTIHHEAATARAEMIEWAAMLRELESNLLPLAKQQTDLLEASYRAGQSDLQAVLRSREQTLELTAAKLDAIREFHLARVRYDAATGHP